MVTPPLAAIDGSTFRLKTATTNSSTKSRCPRTRFRCGWLSAVLASWVNVLLRNSPRNSSTFVPPVTVAAGLIRRLCLPSTNSRHSKQSEESLFDVMTGTACPTTSVLPPPSPCRVRPAPSKDPEQSPQTPQGAYQCPLRYAAPKSSTARPTNTVAPTHRGSPSRTSSAATSRRQS